MVLLLIVIIAYFVAKRDEFALSGETATELCYIRRSDSEWHTIGRSRRSGEDRSNDSHCQ